MNMAPLDLVIRGGSVVDGTGAPARTADVAIRDGRIAAIGRVDDTRDAARVVDADGLTVTPGFIDVHTHYDAQLHWDPTASPASWHGITTLFTGNCGFTLAPAKPDDVEWLMLMLSRVEGMSADALAEGVDFRGGTLGDFLDGLEGRVGVNVAANVGHCALRRYVMGDDASERHANPHEIHEMQALLREALNDGAYGFTSSQLDLHVAHDGRGVPSNHAAPMELVALASVLAEFDRGAIEFIPRTFLTGYDDDDRRLILDLARTSGRPVHLNTLTQMPHAPDGWSRSLEFAREAAAEGLAVHPMFASNRQGAHFSLDTTFLFDEMPSFRDTLTLREPERSSRLKDPALRDRMRAEIADPRGRSFVFVWQALRVESVVDAEHERYLDMSVSEIAEQWNADPLDAFLDLSLAENLATQFVLAAPHNATRKSATEQIVAEPLVMAGSSDGGAHLLSFCGADFTTRLLTEWTPDFLTFEAAVARLTSAPAATQGLTDRGTLAPGMAADVLLIDRDRLATPDSPRYVRDFPAGSGRYVCDATGYVSVIVNGEELLHEGEHTGACPGAILRG
ncbi:MAG TPA: amidohydrolase family protein [Acidimicrobiia bacterium]|nr:amidohydrolase family protein [Acidimicrobiia bacterium]